MTDSTLQAASATKGSSAGPPAPAAGLEPGAFGREGRVFVDFDHTLFLWNSTEAFLDKARPTFLAAPLLKLMAALRPWRAFGKSGYFTHRDFIRAFIILIFFPWTFALFKRSAPRIFSENLNTALDEALGEVDADRIVIVTFGFRFIVKALLTGSRYETAQLVAPGLFNNVALRKGGKVAMLSSAGLAPDRKADVVITDSATDDADLLASVDRGHFVRWPEANYGPGLAGAYVPFFYTARIKRSPGFLVKQVFLEEMLIVLLAFALAALTHGVAVLGTLALLFLAYMMVYEIGYAENDRVGERKEKAPKLSAAYWQYRPYRLEPFAWIYAAITTLAAFAILSQETRADLLQYTGITAIWPEADGAALFVLSGIWMAWLVLSRVSFWLFNAASLNWRVFAYLPLHATKYFGPILFLPLPEVGMALLVAQIIRTWSMYAIRRSGGDEHAIPSQLVRLVFFILFLPLWTFHHISEPDSMTFFTVILAFCLLRAIPELRRKMFRPPQ